MFSNVHFYHRTIRKCVVAFGNMFNQIQLLKYEKGTYNEVERITVPISYSGNENYAQRLLGNPDLPMPVQIKLPRMSFEMIGISYDSARKLSTFAEECGTLNGAAATVAAPTPYNLEFELNIYVRNMEDGTQIVEQILPYFNPDYTFAMTYIDDLGLVKNTPLILNSVEHSNGYEGDRETVRFVTWRLTFTMKTYFYGPVNMNRAIIRTSHANTYLWEANTPSSLITVTPDPITANSANEAFGFDTVIEFRE